MVARIGRGMGWDGAQAAGKGGNTDSGSLRVI
jgi:hypothetical protein